MQQCAIKDALQTHPIPRPCVSSRLRSKDSWQTWHLANKTTTSPQTQSTANITNVPANMALNIATDMFTVLRKTEKREYDFTILEICQEIHNSRPCACIIHYW